MIRLAETGDIPAILEVFDTARGYMRAHGNSVQWVNGYPGKDLLLRDIEKAQLYMMEDKDGRPYGAFAFIIGPDPTYEYIENGSWMDDSEYGTIHRLGSDGIRKGVFKECMDYCKSVIPHLRLDTHAVNSTLQHLAKREGFVERGVIYVEDGTPRVAFEWVKE